MDPWHLALTLIGVVIALVIIFGVAAILSIRDIRRSNEHWTTKTAERLIRKLKDKSGDS